jgi:hypothetical protein
MKSSPHDLENFADQFLLLFDIYRVHRTENFGIRVAEMGRASWLHFTSIFQPLDAAVMKSFKSHARNQWENWRKATLTKLETYEP